MMSDSSEKVVDPEAVGMSGKRLAKVVELFGRQQASGAFPGGQLVVRRHGNLVLNEVVGIARGFRSSESAPPVPVRLETPFPVLSAGKPLAAITIAWLEERGRLDIQAPIAELFPEFAGHGKERLTTHDVLTHRSGMLMPDFVAKTDLWADRAAIQQALIETIPAYPRGTLAYHPHEYGWILSEVVQRVDGRSLADLFVEEFALPLKLPALRFGLAGRDPQAVAFSYWLGQSEVMVAGVNVAQKFEEQNSPAILEAMNPATSLVCNAGSLAVFYDFLLAGGRTPDGRSLLSEETIRKYTTRQLLAWDRSLRTPLALGRGFVVGTWFPSTFGWWNTGPCFGHLGGFSCLAFGDHRKKLSAAIVTNGNKSTQDVLKRIVPLAHKLRGACRT